MPRKRGLKRDVRKSLRLSADEAAKLARLALFYGTDEVNVVAALLEKDHAAQIEASK